MKNLLLIATIVITSSVYSAANAGTCSLTLLKKKASAKSVYTMNGERLSAKTASKLANVCTVKVSIMSEAMKKEMQIKGMEAKLAKLKAAK